MARRARACASLLALGAALTLLSACGKAAEGDSCDLANGNEDCENGLICRGAWELASKEPVCCPRPPARPSTSACQPKITDFKPDPSVDAAPIPPMSDGGGSGGSSGSGGTAGIDAGSDAGSSSDAAQDSGSD